MPFVLPWYVRMCIICNIAKNEPHQDKNDDMVMAFKLNSSVELMFFGPRTPETGCKLRVQRMKKDMRYVS